MSSRPEAGSVELAPSGLLPPLVEAFVAGRDLELLAPLGFTAGEPLPAASSRPAPPPGRARLARALAAANLAYGHPAAAELAAKLADPATRVVATGQQPGLFGGPLYALTKAVAASLWAERLEAAGEPAVAVFWVATEDHDFREVARSVFLGPDGPLALALGDDPAPLLPVGMRSLGPRVTELLGELGEALPGERFATWLERLGSWYRPQARFGEAFARFVAGVLGRRAPLLLDAMLPELKAAEAPWLARLVERREELAAATAARERALEARGYALQVAPQPGASPIFVLQGAERRRLEYRAGGRIALRGRHDFEAPLGWLEELLAENPAALGPGVLARPAIQDAVLGTRLLLLGPGEVSYLPQAAPVYEVLGVAPPTAALRPQALVLGRHQLDKLAELGVSLAELLAPEFDRDRHLAGGAERELLAPLGELLERELALLEPRLLAIDSNLAAPWSKTAGQIERALAKFEARLAAAAARRDEVASGRLDDLRQTCRPLGELQERVVSSAHFPGKYGDGFAAALFEQLGVDGRSLAVISPS